VLDRDWEGAVLGLREDALLPVRPLTGGAAGGEAEQGHTDDGQYRGQGTDRRTGRETVFCAGVFAAAAGYSDVGHMDSFVVRWLPDRQHRRRYG
jgi:hypothetical protein